MFFLADNINLNNNNNNNYLLPEKPKSSISYFVNKQNKASLNLFNTKTMMAAIKLPPKQDKKTYYELPGSSIEDQNKIIELFSTMGSHGKIDLLFHYKKHLEQIGKEIEHVHPLKLLGIIFSTPNMKGYMDNIINDYFKWNSFIDGFEPNMNHEFMKNNLMIHIDDFAKHVNVPKENIIPYFNNKDWKGLIKYLINN